MSKSKSVGVLLLTAGAALFAAATPAQATQLQWSIVVGAPMPFYTVPFVVQPAPVIVQPMPARVWHGYPRMAYREPTHWDRDGDRIPDRYDRLYNPRWDVDGDGVPNRHDRHDDRYRRSR